VVPVWSRRLDLGRQTVFVHGWPIPARNRIIAGLALATVIVEARERSGALITADLALEEGREVFAVPGEIVSSLSRGTNALLKLGAAPLTETEDVLSALGIEAPPQGPPEVGGVAARILGALGDGAASADELGRATGLEAGEIAAALAELELAGLAAEGDGLYRALLPAAGQEQPGRGRAEVSNAAAAIRTAPCADIRRRTSGR
jgi:DNA processing protein